LPEVTTYDELVHAISQARSESRLRTEKAVEEERVREAWEIGRLIDAHVLEHKERADYGQQVLLRLSRDLGMSDTELHYMLEFARAYPIFRPAGKLSWSEYETLLSINDAQERQVLADRSEKESWSRDRLRREVKALKGTGSSAAGGVPVPPERLTARPGRLGTYRIVRATAGPEIGREVIDLGFSTYYKTTQDLRLPEGAVVEAISAVPGAASEPSDRIQLSDRTPEDLYTYRVYIVDILDGDTVKAVIDLGFGVRTVQTLRLRGIDAPELVSHDGLEAKKALEKMLSGSPNVLIRSVKSDKYDRYLADLYTASPDGKVTYLNNLLLEEGYAVKVE